MLCDSCEALVQHALQLHSNNELLGSSWDEPKELQIIEVNAHDVISAAENGCYVCNTALASEMDAVDGGAQIYRGLFDATDQSLRLCRQVEVFLDNTGEVVEMLTEYVDTSGDPFRKQMDRFRLGLSNLGTTSEHEMPEERDIPQHTGDEKILSMIRNWLEECLHGHDYCNNMQSTYLPLRLVDVDLEGGDDTFVVVDTSTLNSALRYVTLSHRWHQDTPRLDSTTQAKFRTMTPWKDLPGTYQDAFQITRSLGFRYIWIDSLCIYQGDRLDMLSEGLAMMQVYSNAVCNIAASRAHSEHIFVDRSPGHVSVVSKLRGQAGSQTPRRITHSDHSLWKREVEYAQLNERGWVLQEQLLSARTLYFSKTQVLWECGIGRRCESYPRFTQFYDRGEEVGQSWGMINVNAPLLYSINDAIYVYVRQIKSLSPDFEARLRSPNLKTEVLYDMWRSFVRAYTGRTISFSIDKLMAIAGVAKLFAEVSNLTWTAGLWKEHMPICLWWNASPLMRRADDVYRAPTWSWAAVDGCVNLATQASWEINRIVAQVLDIQCSTFTSDPFSLLTAGTLRLRAASLPLSMDRRNCFLVIRLPNTTTSVLTVYADRPELPFEFSLKEYGFPRQLDDSNLEPLDPDFVGVALHTYAYDDETEGLIVKIGGLILERLDCGAHDLSQPMYKRAAYFDLPRCKGTPARSLLNWKPELFSFSEQMRFAGKPTHKPFDFDTATDLETFEII